MKGLEPSRLATLAPEASVSTIPPHPHLLKYKGSNLDLSKNCLR